MAAQRAGPANNLAGPYSSVFAAYLHSLVALCCSPSCSMSMMFYASLFLIQCAFASGNPRTAQNRVGGPPF